MKYFEAGERQFIFFERKSFPRLGDRERHEITNNWGDVKLKTPSAFNGGIYCCNGVLELGKFAFFGVNHSDYATYKWAKDNKLLIPGAYTMGTGTYLYDLSRRSFVFGRRTDKVSTDPNTISVASGGVVEYKMNMKVRMGKFLDFLSAQSVKESLEELSVRDLSKEKLLGMYLDEGTYKLELAYLATGIVTGVKNDENEQLIFVPKGQVKLFFECYKNNMEESTRKHLSHWAERLDQFRINARVI